MNCSAEAWKSRKNKLNHLVIFFSIYSCKQMSTPDIYGTVPVVNLQFILPLRVQMQQASL